MRTTIFANNEYFHVYNRGTDKRDIFMNKYDYQRFIAELREFNTKNRTFHLTRTSFPNVVAELRQENDPLVEIAAYSLMPNHFHLLLKQLTDGGISKFLHKVLTGYTKYFNKKYDRTGVLFQGPFKAKHVTNNNYLLHLSRYIHLNSLELAVPDWKEQGIKDINQARDIIKRYEWSSYQFYQNQQAESFLPLKNNIILDQFENCEAYDKFTLSWTIKDNIYFKNSGLFLS